MAQAGLAESMHRYRVSAGQFASALLGASGADWPTAGNG